MKTKHALTLLALAGLPLLAAAQQTIWRCGADGRSYSNVPCAEGRTLETVEARPAADVLAAQGLALREKQRADQMRQARLREEAANAKLGPAGIGDSRRDDAATAQAKARPAGKPHHPSKAKQRSAEDGTWRAVAPASPRAKG
jgi:hypothetical protein